jgi:hypothetical protein
MYGNGRERRLLSPALERHYFSRGLESAMRMDENTPMVQYMRREIEQLLKDADYIDNPADVIGAWDSGFQVGIINRVNHWQNAQKEIRKLAHNPACLSIVCGDGSRRISGTLRAKGNGRKS